MKLGQSGCGVRFFFSQSKPQNCCFGYSKKTTIDVISLLNNFYAMSTNRGNYLVMPHPRAELLGSGRGVGENLMAVTAARPCAKGIPLQCEDSAVDSRCYCSRQNIIHPPDKIFEGIPARSFNFPHVSEDYFPLLPPFYKDLSCPSVGIFSDEVRNRHLLISFTHKVNENDRCPIVVYASIRRRYHGCKRSK